MSAAGWLQLSLLARDHSPEVVEQALLDAGALSVSLTDAGDDPVLEPAPEQTPLWPQTRVSGLFERSVDPQTLRVRLARELGEAALAPGRCFIEDLAGRDWVRVWLEDFAPRRFGRRLWVCPSGEPPPQPGAVNVILDPGLAFGTGSHPSTALCLRWLDALAPAAGKVLDYGCGSGILAVAALRLGATRAVGVDHEPQALEASRANAERNGVAARLELYPPQALPGQSFDIVLANILAGPLIRLAPRIAEHTAAGGRLALAGILSSQAEAVEDAYAPAFEFSPMQHEAGWVLLSGVRRG